jgi:hypothetical protein
MNLLNHNISGYLFTLFAVIVIYVLISRQINELNGKFSNINSVILSNTNDIKKDFKKDIKKQVRHDINENISDIIQKYVVDEINAQNKNDTMNVNNVYNKNSIDMMDTGVDELDDDGLDELDDDGLDELDDDGLDELDDDGLDELDDDGLDELDDGHDELDDDGLSNKTLHNLEKIEHVTEIDDELDVDINADVNAASDCKIIELDDTDDINDKPTPTVIENNIAIKKTNEETFVLDDITVDTIKEYPYNKLSAPQLREIVRKLSLSKNPKNTKKKDLLELIDNCVKSQ